MSTVFMLIILALDVGEVPLGAYTGGCFPISLYVILYDFGNTQ